MHKIYQFKISLSRNCWFRLQIQGNQTFAKFDQLIRITFNHDTFDHLSQFYLGRAWGSEGLGEINPFGGGSGADKKIQDINLIEGSKLEYVYDFGDNICHTITLEKIIEPEKGIKYPHIMAENIPEDIFKSQ